MNGTTALKRETVTANTGNPFPWAGQPDETACNYAFGLLIRNLPARVTMDNKLHAPTLMAAAGAIAGVCAQISLLADAEKIEKARADNRIHEIKFKTDNRLFLHGDALNEMLYSVRDPIVARSRVWNMMVSAALQRGLSRDKLPNVPNMFKYVGESFGTPHEGRPSVEQKAQPVASVRDLLALTGPVAFAALAGEIDPTTTAMAGRANRRHWVAISAQAAANLLFTASKIMPPETCLTIAMESAIYASKMRANAPVEAPTEGQA